MIRKAVKELILSEKKSVKASADNLADYLGVPKYRYGEIEDKNLIGIVTGLAWTDVGGELLTIEAAMMPGKGRMTVTGNLRDVMKESISAAASYVRSRAVAFGIEPPLFDLGASVGDRFCRNTSDQRWPLHRPFHPLLALLLFWLRQEANGLRKRRPRRGHFRVH